MVDCESNFGQLMRAVKLGLASVHKFAQLIGLLRDFTTTGVAYLKGVSFKVRGQVRMKLLGEILSLSFSWLQD
jgi:hypothetical protein